MKEPGGPQPPPRNIRPAGLTQAPARTLRRTPRRSQAKMVAPAAVVPGPRESAPSERSRGFRAPTPGQANVSNVSTIFNASLGDLVESGLTPPTDPTARLFGAQPLEPEESVNYSLGVDWSSPYYGRVGHDFSPEEDTVRLASTNNVRACRRPGIGPRRRSVQISEARLHH